MVEIDLQLDRDPRDVLLPSDMADALSDAPEAKAAFDRLAFGLKRKHVAEIEEARSVNVRHRRIGKLVAALRAAHSP